MQMDEMRVWKRKKKMKMMLKVEKANVVVVILVGLLHHVMFPSDDQLYVDLVWL